MTETTLTVEIVTFRAAPGAESDAVRAAAQGLNAFLETRDGFICRTLSQDADGTWTDHVVWTDLASSKAAARAIMAEPAAGALMELVDPDSIRMTHAPILVRKAA